MNLRGLPLKEKILRSIRVAENGCWLWQKGISTGGYGKLCHFRKTLLAHRVSYEVFQGPIADGLVLDHLCRNRSCCNPSHLQQVTTKTNLQRGIRATKPSCIHGHPLHGDNLYTPPESKRAGKRKCRTCIREASRRYRMRNRMTPDEIDEACKNWRAA